MALTLVTWPTLCLPGFSILKLLFPPPFPTALFGSKSPGIPHSQGYGKEFHLLQGKVTTYIIWNSAAVCLFPLIYSIIYFYQSRLVGIYFILSVII